MNPLLQEALGAIFRKGLTVLATWLVAKGVWTHEGAETYVAAGAIFLVSLSWTLWKTYSKRLKLITALAMPRQSTEKEVENVIRAGMAPPSTVKKHDCPYLPASARTLINPPVQPGDYIKRPTRPDDAA